MNRIAVLGAGYWGKNLIRNFHELGALKGVCEPSDDLRNGLKAKYPDIELWKNHQDTLKSDAEGVVVATPASTHYALAKQALEEGKHVFVEKPLTTDVGESEELVALAEKKNLRLMVGFTFLYNAAVEKIYDLIGSGSLGEIYYIYSQRLNLGKVRQDINVWWNLAPHDVSIILYLLGKKPVEASGHGFEYLQKGIEDIVYASVRFEDGSAALIHTSWLDPNKIRKMTIVGSRQMVVYDDVSADMKVQVYDKGIDRKNINEKLAEYENFAQFQLIQRAGDIHVPKISFQEPLRTECSHFLECIETGKEPLTSGRRSLDTVRVLAAVQKSVKDGGRPVSLN